MLLGVGDRQRPLLLDAGRHEDAVVHVVQPGERGQVVVDLREVVAVLAQRLRGEHDAALGADALGVAGEAVARDDLVATAAQAVVGRTRVASYAAAVSTSVSAACAAAITSGLPLNVPYWWTVPSAIDRGQLLGHADRAAGQTAAAGLGQRDHVGRDAEALRRAARRDRCAGLDLVEDQDHAVLGGDAAHVLEVALDAAARC